MREKYEQYLTFKMKAVRTHFAQSCVLKVHVVVGAYS